MLLGAGLGAVVALFYSPGTGEQNRKNLNLWAHHRLDDVQRKVEGVVKREG
jgi:gas vesicle protein